MNLRNVWCMNTNDLPLLSIEPHRVHAPCASDHRDSFTGYPASNFFNRFNASGTAFHGSSDASYSSAT